MRDLSADGGLNVFAYAVAPAASAASAAIQATRLTGDAPRRGY
ncbi:hypothetical protein [Streptomyces phaeochromogenes]